MGGVFAEKSFAVTIMLLMIVPAIPLPTGGVTHVFEVITVLLAAQMVLGRGTIWLPERWQKRELGDAITGKAIPSSSAGYSASSGSRAPAGLGCLAGAGCSGCSGCS